MSQNDSASALKSTTVSAPGYRKKPIWIYVVSIVLMLSPLGNLLYSLATMNVPGWYKPSVWIYWARFVTPSTWALLGLLFLAGVMLLFVRRWSWAFSMSVLGFVVVYDLVMIKQFLALGPAAVIAMFVGTLSFALVLYFSEFRKPYLNPRVRWWETSPRFKVALPVHLSEVALAAKLVDISRTGVLVEWPGEIALPETDARLELTLKEGLKLPVLAKRRTPHGLGLQFAALSSEQKKSLLTFIADLEVDPTQAGR